MFVSYEEILKEELRHYGLSIDDITSGSPDGQQDAPSSTKDGAADALTGMTLDPFMIIPRANVDPSGEPVICFYSFYHVASHEREGASQTRWFTVLHEREESTQTKDKDKVGKYRLDPTNSYFPARRCSFVVSKITVKEDELSKSTWELLNAFLQECHNLKPSLVYRLAGIPAATFTRIRNRKVQPKKENLLKIGIVLKLTLNQMTDFLASAGFAFNPSDKRDVLIKKCFEERVLHLQDITQKLEDEKLDKMDFNLELLDKLVSDQLTSR